MSLSQRKEFETRCGLSKEMIGLYVRVMYCHAQDSSESVEELIARLKNLVLNSDLAPIVDDICEGANIALCDQSATPQEVTKMLTLVIQAIQNPEEVQLAALENSAVDVIAKRNYDEGIFKLGVAMFALGGLLTIFGALVIAASLGVCATGILAPLATLGMGVGIALCATGVATAATGLGLAIHQLNQENSISPSPR